MNSSLSALGLKIVAIANQKGGVGKTMTALSLASGLAKRGQKVLAVDGDPQGDLSLFFGADTALGAGEIGGNGMAGGLGGLLADLTAGRPADLSGRIIRRVRRNLDLLAGPPRRLRSERSDAELRAAAPGFSAALDRASKAYDWVILDCSPSDGALERLLLSACQAVLIPLEFQLFSIAGLQAMLDTVASCGAEAGREIRVQALIFTKAENRVGRVEDYRKLFSEFRLPIFEVCKSEYLPRSVERSRTIWEGGPASYAARDYARIIDKAFLEAQA